MSVAGRRVGLGGRAVAGGKDGCKVEHGLCLLGRDVNQGSRGIASASIDTDFEPKGSGKRSGRVQKKRGSKP